MAFDYTQRVATHIDDHPLGKLLDCLKMESAFYTSSVLTAPWGIDMPPMPSCMMIHLVVEGSATFRVEGNTFTLEEGDFVLFPKGNGHALFDDDSSVLTPLAELPIEAVTERYETLFHGGEGVRCKMVCGAMVFQHPLAIKLLGVLPSHIIINSAASVNNATIAGVINLLKIETQHIEVGVEAVISRLADILVMTAMRQYLSELDGSKLSWLSALEDERIGKSLKLLHERPDKHWNLEELANAIGMSRTSFAQKFKKLVGNSPMDYLTEWRMSLAYSRLQLTNDTILSIALAIGYQSDATFSRAFKKVIGKSPGEVRRDFQSAQITESSP